MKEKNEALGEKLGKAEEKAQMAKNEMKNMVIKLIILEIFSWKRSSSNRKILKLWRHYYPM
jgi:hypothetical protein